MAEQDFPFIVSSGPKVSKDPAVRTMIRKQAMKDVIPLFEETVVPIRPSASAGASNVRSGSHSSSSSSAVPSLDRSSSSPESWESDLADIDEFFPRLNDTKIPEQAIQKYSSPSPSTFDSILASLSFNPEYELARMKYGVDVTNLSTLTNFNVSKSAITLITADSFRLGSIMSIKQWSYLEYVPARYGTSECLTDATNCLLAKMQLVLSPNGRDRFSTLCHVLYGRALQSLQKALTSDMSDDSDVLAATQLLSLHELLDPTRDMAWSHHVGGSARLIAHRSPKRFTTEFDKALFASHVGAMVSENLVGNQHCYLENPEWTELYASIAQESDFLTDRSQLAIDLRKIMFRIPGVWRDISDWTNSDELFSRIAPTMLERRCRQTHQELIDWMEDYKSHVVRLSFAEVPQTELAIRRELLGSALECLVIVKRLLATVCDVSRLSLETEVQAIAQLSLKLQDDPQPKHSWLFTAHEIAVAQVAILTTEAWEERNTGKNEKEIKLAIRKRYNTWSNTLRMSGPED